MAEQEQVTRSIRIPLDLAEAIDKRATEDRRSFSNYVAVVLEDHINKASAAAPAKAPNGKTAKVSA